MAGKEDANFSFASRFENLNNSVRDLLPIFDLVHDSDLHVVDDQRQAPSITKHLPAFAEYSVQMPAA